MFFVGLVHENRWQPPDDAPEPPPRTTWRVPWRELIWLVAVFGLLGFSSVAGHALGGLAGYAVLMVAVALGLWRLDRWCARQYWRALRDYQA